MIVMVVMVDGWMLLSNTLLIMVLLLLLLIHTLVRMVLVRKMLEQDIQLKHLLMFQNKVNLLQLLLLLNNPFLLLLMLVVFGSNFIPVVFSVELVHQTLTMVLLLLVLVHQEPHHSIQSKIHGVLDGVNLVILEWSEMVMVMVNVVSKMLLHIPIDNKLI